MQAKTTDHTNQLSRTAASIYCRHFEAYKSNVCHFLHHLGDIGFIRTILADDTITQFARNNYGAWALYLLAMLDYISKENGVPVCTKYEYLRGQKLERLHIPDGIRINLELFGNQELFERTYKNAIPEFLKYNIMEGDVRNVN